MTDNSSSISSADWLELSNLVRETTDTSSISSEDWLEQDLPIETGLAEEDSLALKSSHVQVSHVLPSHFLPSQFLPSQVLPSQRKEEKGQFYNPSSVALWLLGMAVLSVITAGIVILTKSYKSEDATNNVFNRGVNEPILLDDSESPRLKMLREMLIPLSGIDSLSDSSSPQYAAMAWLADEDPAILDLGVTPFNTISDRYIVVLLYFGTTGNGWRAQRDFLTETNICEWNDGGEGGAFEGIRCLNNEVVDIILDMNSLKGTIPTEIGLFNLNSLGLGANSLEGTIPTEIGAMKNLEKLSLSGNFLQGTIPKELGNLSNLQALFLHNNQLKGVIPETFRSLIDLKVLYIEGNDITGSLDSILCEGNDPFQYFYADCADSPAEIVCSCCTHCCHTDGSGCKTTSSDP